MTTKFHIGKNGPAPCHATKRACRFGGGETHYDSMEEAVSAYENTVEEEKPKTANGDNSANGSNSDNSAENQGKEGVEEKGDILDNADYYSVLEVLEERQKEWGAKFENVPNGFHKKDLLKGISGSTGYVDAYEEIEALVDSDDLTDEELKQQFDAIMLEKFGKGADRDAYRMWRLIRQDYYHRNKIALATKKDGDIDLETLENEVLSDLGMKVIAVSGRADDVVAVDENGTGYYINRLEESAKYNMNSTIYTGYMNGDRRRTWSVRDGEEVPNHCMNTDVRTMVAMARAKDLIGQSPFLKESDEFKLDDSEKTGHDRIDKYRRNAKIVTEHAKTLGKIRSAQIEKRAYDAQTRYIAGNEGKTIARAYTDKKYIDQDHIDWAKNSPVSSNFTKVELDNEVGKEEWESFSADLKETMAKMPKIPENRKPELRMRLLGKHRATGLYVPAYNSVCIDLRDTSSAVHELSHQFDIGVKGSISTGEEFRPIYTHYAKNLEVPKTNSTSKYNYDYYTQPSEVFARGFEIYASEKLGIENRTLNAKKFNDFDYQPFKDEKVKQKMFKFFDSLYE